MAKTCDNIMFQLAKQFLYEECLPPNTVITWVLTAEKAFPLMEPQNDQFIFNDLKEMKRNASGILSPWFDYAKGQPTKLGSEPYQIPRRRNSLGVPATKTVGTQTIWFEPRDWIRYSWAVDDRVNETI